MCVFDAKPCPAALCGELTPFGWYRTYHEWTARTLQKFGAGVELHRPSEPIPAGINRLKRSLTLLKSLERVAASHPCEGAIGMEQLTSDLLAALDRTNELVENDEHRLLNA